VDEIDKVSDIYYIILGKTYVLGKRQVKERAKAGSKNRRSPRPLFLVEELLSKLSAYFEGKCRASFRVP
jgi:hypothetical protein